MSGGLNVVKCNLWGLVCSVMEVNFIVLCGNVIFIFIGISEYL